MVAVSAVCPVCAVRAVCGVGVVAFHALQVNLVVAGEAFAVVPVVGERLELLEALLEPLAAGPAVIRELVDVGRLRVDHNQAVVAAAQPDFVAGVDAGDLALPMEGSRRRLELVVAGVMRLHHLGGGAGHAGRFLCLVHARHINGYRVLAGEYAQMRHDGHIRMVAAVALGGDVYRHIDVADLFAADRFLYGKAGVGDGDVHGVEVDGRDFG